MWHDFANETTDHESSNKMFVSNHLQTMRTFHTDNSIEIYIYI